MPSPAKTEPRSVINSRRRPIRLWNSRETVENSIMGETSRGRMGSEGRFPDVEVGLAEVPEGPAGGQPPEAGGRREVPSPEERRDQFGIPGGRFLDQHVGAELAQLPADEDCPLVHA